MDFTQDMNVVHHVDPEQDDAVFCALNAGGRIVDVGSSAPSITGYDSIQLLGHDMASLIHPEDQGTWMRELAASVSMNRRLRAACRMRKADGTYAITEFLGDPSVINPQQYGDGSSGLLVYISARMQRANSLAVSNLAIPPLSSAAQLSPDVLYPLNNELFLGVGGPSLDRGDPIDGDPETMAPLGHFASSSLQSNSDVYPWSSSPSSSNFQDAGGRLPDGHAMLDLKDHIYLSRNILKDDRSQSVKGDSTASRDHQPDGVRAFSGVLPGNVTPILTYQPLQASEIVEQGSGEADLRSYMRPSHETSDSIEANETDKEDGSGPMLRKCQSCGTSTTPAWRRGPEEGQTLCNACGLRWSKMQKNINKSPPGREDNEFRFEHWTPYQRPNKKAKAKE